MAKKPELDVSQRVRELRMHRINYYSGTPTITDAEFDAMEEELQSLVPNHHYFNSVGAKLSGVIPVKHVVPMLSMDKIKEASEVGSWLNRIHLPLTQLLSIMPKVDGISGSLDYNQNGRLEMGSTRGHDGTEGSLIRHLEEIPGIPQRLPYSVPVSIRGEFYLPQHLRTSEKYFSDKVLRNFCGGILRRDDRTEDLKYVRFVAYNMVGNKDILNGPVSMQALLQYISTYFPNVVPCEIVTALKVPGLGIKTVAEYTEEYLRLFRNQWDYETDGLVISVDDMTLHRRIDKAQGGAKSYHHYNIALKPPSRKAETTLPIIEWNTSRQGRVVPIGMIARVLVGGVEVTSIGLDNASNVLKLGLKKDDKIIVERANDVIPRLVQVLGGGSTLFELPTKCPSCEDKLEWDKNNTHLLCENKNCGGRKIALIEHWVNQCRLDNVGPEVIKDLYRCGAVQTILDLYTTDIDSILSVLPGYKEGGSRIDRINDGIRATIGTMTEFDIIARIGIPGVAVETLKRHQINGVKDLMEFQKDSNYKYEAEKSMHTWVSKPENITLLLALVNVLKAKYQPKTLNTNSKHVIFCITGGFPKSRDTIIEYLEGKGYEFSNTVNSRTTCLIQGEGEGSTKLDKAIALGIPVVNSIEDFEKMFP